MFFRFFLLSGEITIPIHLQLMTHRYIAVDTPNNPTVIQINIKASKTDPFGQGVCNTYWSYIQYSTLCPVTALLNYLALSGNDKGLLFHFHDSSPLTKNKFTSKVRDILSQAGIDSSLYAGHSLQIGAVSTTAANGVEDSLIQTLGHWKFSAYLTYV